MSYRKRTDFEIEQQVLLGGRISSKKQFNELQLYAIMEPDQAFLHWFLSNYERLKGLAKKEFLLEIVKWNGLIEQLKVTTELTKLSMAVGDTRKWYSAKTGEQIPGPSGS